MGIRTRRGRWLAPLIAIGLLGAVVPPGVAAADHPTVRTTTVEGPVAIPPNASHTPPLATLHLPKGTWVAWSRLHTLGAALVTCRLTLPGSSEGDTHRARVRTSGWSLWQAVSGHTASPAGMDVELSCDAGNTPGITADRIRIVAMRVADLTRVDMAEDEAIRVGSGSPRAIQGHRTSPIDVPAASTPQAIARIRLPAGRWWLTATVGLRAKPNLGGGAALATSVTCRLSGDGRIDSVTDSVSRSGAPYDHMSHALHGLADLEHTTTVTLRCSEPSEQYGPDIEARDLRITALQLGAVTTGTLPLASHASVDRATAIPAGDSWVTIVERPLRPGRWFMTGNVSPTAAECRIRLGTATDSVPDWNHPMIMVRTTSESTAARLECRSPEDPGTVRQVRLTAIRVAPATRSQ